MASRILARNALILSIGCSGVSVAAAGNKIPVEYCQNARLITEKAVICHNNPEFVHWGKQCLERFEALVERESKSLSQGFTPIELSRQSKKFGVSGSDYAQTVARLDYLIGLNQVAIHDVQQYLQRLITPIDDRYLEEVKCFTVNRGRLREILAQFEKKLSELSGARTVAFANKGTSSDREAAITTTLSPGAVKGGQAATGTGQIEKGGSKKSSSDVTGTKEDEAKRRKRN